MTKPSAAEIKERSPLYDGLSDDEAQVFFCIVDGLAQKIAAPDVPPDERTAALEGLIYKGYAEIVEVEKGFTVRLTHKGFAEANPMREVAPFLFVQTEGEA